MALQEEFKVQGDFLFRHRSNLPLLILLVGYIVFINHQYNIGTVNNWWINSFNYFCLGVSLFGFMIRSATVGHTPVRTSGRNTKEGQVAETLNTTGIYSTVRHPLYLGNFLMWLGVGMLTREFWFVIAFIFIYWVYYERIMYAEEQFLRNKFGDDYVAWASGTNAFVPNFRKYQNSELFFSWKKVLKKEKNGLFAVFVLFFLFVETGKLINNDQYRFEYGFWFYGALVSGLLYLNLKILKKYSRFLNEENR